MIQLMMDLQQEESVWPHLTLVPPPVRMPRPSIGRPLVKIAEAELQVRAACATAKLGPWRGMSLKDVVECRKVLYLMVEELHEAGFSTREIARVLGRSPSRIKNIKNELGLGWDTTFNAKPCERWLPTEEFLRRWAALTDEQFREGVVRLWERG